MMETSTVTHRKKITYLKSIPNGFITLTIPEYNQETSIRLPINHIECYYAPNTTHHQPAVGSFVRMVSGKAWYVKETPELIDILINKYTIRPDIGPR
jgi:hypothetical protein